MGREAQDAPWPGQREGGKKLRGAKRLRGRGHLFSDLQGTLTQWLGLTVAAPLSVKHRQVVEGCSHLWKLGVTVAQRGPDSPQHPPSAPERPQLTAGCSGPRVCSRICRASWSRSVASLYLFWSLWEGHRDPWVPLFPNSRRAYLPQCLQGPSPGAHRYTRARMLSMVATSGWQRPEVRSRSSSAWRHSGTATS